MSDMGRQSLTDKAGSAMKPDSQKSYLEQAGDAIKGKADNAPSGAQPSEQKSWTQQAGDAIGGNKNQSSDTMMDKAANALGMGNSNTKSV